MFSLTLLLWPRPDCAGITGLTKTIVNPELIRSDHYGRIDVLARTDSLSSSC